MKKLKPPHMGPRSLSSSIKPVPHSWSTKLRRHSTSSNSSTESFHDAHFPASEEAQMIESSNTLKKSGNAQFTSSDYSSAITTYERAAAELPSYLDYELALLQSNIAACNIKLEQWKDAVDACERALQGLEREMPTPKTKNKDRRPKIHTRKQDSSKKKSIHSESESGSEIEDLSKNTIVELPSDNDEEADAAVLKTLHLSDLRKADIHRIRTKTLLRRARAKSSMTPTSWSNLGEALEDYKLLSSPDYFAVLPTSDQRTVKKGLVELPPRINEAKEKEVGEMMGKLKELGNGILKPFGLSTDMFKMVKDEKTGGYSMNFEQGTKNRDL